ncbi:MAG: hypothetical protein HQ519_00120 [Planctomycetes bacterium]|nr:hypothetical protein [Planctomycetota bacterium]
MAATIATQEPASVVAGDTVKWTKLLDDYRPEDGWTLTYEIVSPTADLGSFAAADNGDGSHLVSIAAATTAAWSAGAATWGAYAAKAGERYQVDKGRLVIEADLASASTHDGRSHARKTLEAIEAVIAKRATKDQMGHSIEGRSLARTPIPDLLVLRKTYLAEVDAEERKADRDNGKTGRNKVYSQFGGF